VERRPRGIRHVLLEAVLDPCVLFQIRAWELPQSRIRRADRPHSIDTWNKDLLGQTCLFVDLRLNTRDPSLRKSDELLRNEKVTHRFVQRILDRDRALQLRVPE